MKIKNQLMHQLLKQRRCVLTVSSVLVKKRGIALKIKDIFKKWLKKLSLAIF
jgi:hypothetical protein